MSEQQQDAMDQLQEPTSWPKVIGITSMIWGGLSITCAGCGAIGAIASVSMIPEEMKSQGLPPGVGLNLSNGISIVVGSVMSILLFVAGLATLRRSMTGRTLHIVWSALSIVWIPVALYLMYRQDAEMRQWIADNPDSPFSKQPGAGSNIGLIIGVTITLIFSLYPVFVFIWFMFIKKTRESFGAEAVKDYI